MIAIMYVLAYQYAIKSIHSLFATAAAKCLEHTCNNARTAPHLKTALAHSFSAHTSHSIPLI